PAVQVPQGAWRELVDPLRGTRVERRRDLAVGLEEALGPQQEGDASELHAQVLLGRERDLGAALEDGLVLGEDVRARDRDGLDALAQRGQVLAQPRDGLGRPQYPSHHEPARGRLGHEDVLAVTAPRGDVVRGEPGELDEVGEVPQGGTDAGGVQAALAQVVPPPTGVEDAEARSLERPGDDHLRLVAKALLAARDRVEPCRAGGGRTGGLGLARELDRVRLGEPPAGPALGPVVVPALHPARLRRGARMSEMPPIVWTHAHRPGSWVLAR